MSPVPAPICRIRLKTAPAEIRSGEITAVRAMRTTTETRPTTISSRSPAPVTEGRVDNDPPEAVRIPEHEGAEGPAP